MMLCSSKLKKLKGMFKDVQRMVEWYKIEKVSNELRTNAKAGSSDPVLTYQERMDLPVQADELQIKKAEECDLVKKFTALNLDFESRVKDENRETDMKNRNHRKVLRRRLTKRNGVLKVLKAIVNN